MPALLLLALLALCTVMDGIEVDTSLLQNEELAEYRRAQVAEIERHVAAGGADSDRAYFCTVYYTPREGGFTAAAGFDVTPTAAPGLGKRRYPAAFLQAVKLEGYGRLVIPVNKCAYLQYIGRGMFRFAKAPLGSRGEALVPGRSCAVARQSELMSKRQKLLIDSPTVRELIGANEWTIADLGHGLQLRQIDLYWGEDDPKGPSLRDRARPAGCKMEYSFDVRVQLR